MQSLVTPMEWAAIFGSRNLIVLPFSVNSPPHAQAYSKGLPSKACAVWQFYSTDSFVLVVQTTDNAHYVMTSC